LDGVASFGWVKSRLFQQKLSSWKSNIRELSVDPTTSLGAVMGANINLAGFIHQILLAKFLVIQVNWVICSV
jgi:hypothetical protein